MEGIGVRLLTRVVRAAVPAAGLLALQARRLLLLQYQSYPTEFLGCVIGAVSGDTVIVQRIAPADVESAESATSDGRSFGLQPSPVDAIMCGDRIVWIGRDLVEQQQPLGAGGGAAP